MKRFLSMMLAVMLILSSFAVASADSFSVIEAGGDGVTHSFGTPFDGYYRVSAEVYMTDDVEGASIIAVNGDEVVATTEINVAANEWAPVSVDVKGAAFDGVKFIAESGKIYANNIKVEKLGLKTLLYSEDFNSYEDGENVYTKVVSKKYSGDVNSTLNAEFTQVSEFNAATLDGERVANLNQPGYSYVSSTDIPTQRYDNDGNKVDGILLATTKDATGSMVEGNEYYQIDINEIKDETHIIVEFDLYNAANALHYTTTEYDLTDISKIMDTVRFGITYQGYDHNEASEIPAATLRANQITLTGRQGSTKYTDVSSEAKVAPKQWNKVTYEIKKEPYNDTQWRVESKLTYGGVTVENETYPAYVKDFGRLIFNIPTASGGRYYIDNLKAYRVSEDIEDVYIERFAEDFDGEGYTVGQAVPGYTFMDNDNDKTDYSTFTVENQYSDNNSNYGRIYNKGYKDSSAVRTQDDGTTPDGEAALVSSGNTEWFTRVLPGDLGVSGYGAPNIGDTKKTKISFRYYLPLSTRNAAEDKDKLWFGFTRADLVQIETNNEVFKFSADRNSIDCYYKNEVPAYVNGYVTHSVRTRQWVPVTMEIASVCTAIWTNDVRYTHTVTFTIDGATNTLAFHNSHDFTKMFVGVDKNFGGSAFIDDILYSTPIEASEVEAKIASGDVTSVGHTVYSAGTTVRPIDGDYRVLDASISKDAQSITIVKAPGVVENNVSILLAIYKGGVLQDAKITPLDASEKVPFNNFVVNIAEDNLAIIPDEIDGETFRVFVFDTEAGLVPLADMRGGTVTAPAGE